MGRREKNLHDKLRYHTDMQLLNLIRHGRPVFDGNNMPVLDDQGNQLRQPPTGSDIANAIKRLRDVGQVQGDSASNPSGTHGEIMQRLRKQNMKGRTPERDMNIAGRIEQEG
jgi:hypothetical protein